MARHAGVGFLFDRLPPGKGHSCRVKPRIGPISRKTFTVRLFKISGQIDF
jgi:hypothetical protein